MSIVDTPSYSDVTVAQIPATLPWRTTDRMPRMRRLSHPATLPPSAQGIRKQENTVADWALGTPIGVALIWALMIGFCIGFWAALWFLLPSVLFAIVVGLPLAVWLLLACWTERKVAARRHLSFRLSRVFGAS